MFVWLETESWWHNFWKQQKTKRKINENEENCDFSCENSISDWISVSDVDKRKSIALNHGDAENVINYFNNFPIWIVAAESSYWQELSIESFNLFICFSMWVNTSIFGEACGKSIEFSESDVLFAFELFAKKLRKEVKTQIYVERRIIRAFEQSIEHKNQAKTCFDWLKICLNRFQHTFRTKQEKESPKQKWINKSGWSNKK